MLHGSDTPGSSSAAASAGTALSAQQQIDRAVQLLDILPAMRRDHLTLTTVLRQLSTRAEAQSSAMDTLAAEHQTVMNTVKTMITQGAITPQQFGTVIDTAHAVGQTPAHLLLRLIQDAAAQPPIHALVESSLQHEPASAHTVLRQIARGMEIHEALDRQHTDWGETEVSADLYEAAADALAEAIDSRQEEINVMDDDILRAAHQIAMAKAVQAKGEAHGAKRKRTPEA